MATSVFLDGDSLEIVGPVEASDLRSLKDHEHIEKLTLTNHPLVTVALAKQIARLTSIKSLDLRCSVTRSAMRDLVGLPLLEEVYLLEIRHPGKLMNFIDAVALRSFRSFWMTEVDLIEILRAPRLEVLGAQSSHVTQAVVDAVTSSGIRELDFESTGLDDDLIKSLAVSSTLASLQVGANPLTAIGLQTICKMVQMRELDVWATNVVEEDLELLLGLPNLEYLSVGGYDGQTKLTAAGVLPRLAQMKSLKRIWLDQIYVPEEQLAQLHETYEAVHYTYTPQ